jgi:hypothetical protein
MATSELNHEKRSGAVSLTKARRSNKTYNALLDKLDYLEWKVEVTIVLFYRKWIEYCK